MNPALQQLAFFAQGTVRKATEKAVQVEGLNVLQIIVFSIGAFLLLTTWYAKIRGRASLGEALRWSVVLLAVCSFALFPKLSTRLAVFLGYNNGRFLALYASVIVLFVCVVLLYSRTRKLSREITLLVRQIAIQRGHDAIEDRRRDQKLDARSGDQDSCSV
ncbi:MAG: DUF2304 domain-containing protein [Planctomycetes bacterium]|nr:DUF2304 domain-containing protein [Planctomycetota bacterium]